MGFATDHHLESSSIERCGDGVNPGQPHDPRRRLTWHYTQGSTDIQTTIRRDLPLALFVEALGGIGDDVGHDLVGLDG